MVERTSHRGTYILPGERKLLLLFPCLLQERKAGAVFQSSLSQGPGLTIIDGWLQLAGLMTIWPRELPLSRHSSPIRFTIPQGIPAEIDATTGRIQLLEAAVA